MPDLNGKVMFYLNGTVYLATPSTDLTTMLTRRIKELGPNATANFKSIIASAGWAN
jgi:hypothetical protein